MFGDMDGDGRITYTDQKLFDMYCNPSSPDYEGLEYQPSRPVYRSSISSPSLGDYIKALPAAIIITSIVMLCALTEYSVLGILLAVPVLIAWLIIRHKMVKQADTLDTEGQLKKRQQILTIWIVFICIAICFLLAAPVFASSADRFMESTIDPFSGKVGKSISWDDWHALWRRYNALERNAGMCLGLAIGFGCVGGYGYYLEWKVADRMKRQANEKEEPAASK